ncbi:hypothetical protein AAMO2058_000805600 [Amorphochlora amoebiformis]
MPSREAFIEIGRLVCINYGKDSGKLGVILDICDTMTALVDGPNLKRGIYNFRRMAVTGIKLPISKSVKSTTLYKAWEAADLDGQFGKTSWGQKLARQERRKNLTDFERFKVKVLKAKKNKIIKSKLKELKN